MTTQAKQVYKMHTAIVRKERGRAAQAASALRQMLADAQANLAELETAQANGKAHKSAPEPIQAALGAADAKQAIESLKTALTERVTALEAALETAQSEMFGEDIEPEMIDAYITRKRTANVGNIAQRMLKKYGAAAQPERVSKTTIKLAIADDLIVYLSVLQANACPRCAQIGAHAEYCDMAQSAADSLDDLDLFGSLSAADDTADDDDDDDDTADDDDDSAEPTSNGSSKPRQRSRQRTRSK